MTVWVSTYDDSLWALKHPEVFSSAAEAIDIGQSHDLIPLQIDPPLHTKYRRFLAEWFNSRAIAPLEPEVRKLVNELLDGIVERGGCDFHQDFATPLPSTVFLAMMGLPQDDLDALLRWRDDIIRPAADPQEAEAIRARTGAEITAYFDAQIDGLRASPRPGFWSDLVNAEFEGRPLDPRRAARHGVPAHHRRARHRHRDARLHDRVPRASTPTVAASSSSGPSSPPTRSRRCSACSRPVQLVPRLIAQDATIGGVDVKAGDHATIVLGAANLDPGDLRPSPRTSTSSGERSINLAFGGGPHLCLGINLARLELRVALEEWHRRIPEYSIPAGTVIAHSPGIRQADHLPLVWDVG